MLGGLCFPVAQFRGFQERCMGREGTECLPVLIILLACGKYGHVMGGVLLPVVHRVSSLRTDFRKPSFSKLRKFLFHDLPPSVLHVERPLKEVPRRVKGKIP